MKNKSSIKTPIENIVVHFKRACNTIAPSIEAYESILEEAGLRNVEVVPTKYTYPDTKYKNVISHTTSIRLDKHKDYNYSYAIDYLNKENEKMLTAIKNYLEGESSRIRKMYIVQPLKLIDYSELALIFQYIIRFD